MRKIIIILGFILIITGILWPWLVKIGIGKLPGDIIIERENFKFYFPLVSCLIFSIIISFILWVLNK